MSYLKQTPTRRPLTRRLARLAAGMLLTPVVILGVATATASAATPCTATLASMTASQSGCWQPFTAGSPINTPLPANPKLAADNGAVQAHMASYGWNLQGSTSAFSLSDNGTRPVYYASPTDPQVTVDCTDEEGPNTCQGYNAIDVNGATINVPAGAMPGNNWDAHMIIVETATGEEYDFWHTSITGSTLTAGSGSVENVNTTNGTQDAGDAANLALTAGLLTPSQLASGHINHALVVDIPCTDAHGASTGYSYPATGGWGETCGDYWTENPTGAPTIGQLFKLNMTDAQIAKSGAPAWQQTIMTALAHYGAYAEDTNGSWHNEGIYIFTQDPTSWTSLGQANPWTTVINKLGGQNGTLSSNIPIPVSQLQVVNPCVPEGTCPGATGPTPTPVTTPVTNGKHTQPLAAIATAKTHRKTSRHSTRKTHAAAHAKTSHTPLAQAAANKRTHKKHRRAHTKHHHTTHRAS